MLKFLLPTDDSTGTSGLFHASFIPFVQSHAPCKQSNNYQLKRDLIYRNGLRNRLISRKAKELVRASRAKRSKVYPRLKGRDVAIFVDNIGHALVLAEQCDCAVLADPESTKSIDDHLRSDCLISAESWLAENYPLSIVTAAGLRNASKANGEFNERMSRLGCIVRADAGTGILPMPGSLLTEAASIVICRLLLIDFDDRHHPVFRKNSKTRREAYKAMGWIARKAKPAPDGMPAGTQC